jgi:flagellar motor switch protein FliN/FliY
MSELDLDKELEALGGAIAGEGDSAGGGASGMESLSEDLGSLVGGGEDAPKEKGGDDFTLDDDMQAAMKEPSSGGGQQGVMSSAAFAPVSSGGSHLSVSGESPNLEFLLDIKLNVTFEVGRAKMLISDLLTLGQGSVIELHRLVGDELDLLVNGRLIAKGEVVVINEKFGCKITSIISPEDRVKHMGGM